MALIALLAAAALSAQPASLVLGKDTGADLILRAPAQARVSFSANVGAVGDAARAGDVWQARFTPPKVRAPTVAQILAVVDTGGDRDLYWLALPLAGSDTMEIETRPGSEVEALVAGTRIGPVTADKTGTARLPMVVPPGVDKGTLKITDKLGNSNEKPLDLEPPPFSRLRLASRDEAAAYGTALEVEVFVVRPDGTPDDHAKVELAADAGATELQKRVGPGIYLFEYQAPQGKSGSATLTAKAEGQTANLDVSLRATGAPRLWQSALSSRRAWGFSAGAIGGVGATFDGGASGALLLEGALRLRDLPLEAVLEVGGSIFSEVTQGVATNGDTNASTQAWLLQVGVRASRQLVRGLDGHATLLVGAQNQRVHVTSINTPASDDAGWTPRLALALGASMRLGPGRALAQLQADTSGSGVAGLTGSVSGLQLQIGYLFALR